MRLRIVAVVGCSQGNFGALDTATQTALASQALLLGGYLAKRDVHLLTGGGGGIMAEVGKGFARVGSRVGLAFATIPSRNDFPNLLGPNGVYQPKRGYPNEWVEIPIFTHLDGANPKGIDSRNHLNALTADLMIVFPGGTGTMAELNLALNYGVPTVAWLNGNQTVGGSSTSLALGCKVVSNFLDVQNFVEQNLMLKPDHLNPQTTTKQIEITFQANGEGTLEAKGLDKFPCLGQPGRKYPKDLTVNTEDKEATHYSQEFGVLMNWAIRIWGQVGIYIHEGFDTLDANGGPSAGCIHLGLGNAKSIFDWVDTRTRVRISYPW